MSDDDESSSSEDEPIKPEKVPVREVQEVKKTPVSKAPTDYSSPRTSSESE